MKKLIVLGIGKNFDFLDDQRFWDFIDMNYEVIKIIDKNKKEKKYINNRIYDTSTNISEEYKKDRFWFFVTTMSFEKEIISELIEKGVRADRILSFEVIWNQYLKYIFHTNKLNGLGVEIGGPTEMFDVIYSNCKKCDGINYSKLTVWGCSDGKIYRYGEKILGDEYVAEATNIPIENNVYDFLLSSNNLEHIANPLKAVEEFIRIVKPGGIIIILVPNKEYCFDHKRDATIFSHLLWDYSNNTSECDLTHMEEILELHDLKMGNTMRKEELEIQCKNNKKNRCMHHHVFDIQLLNEIAEYFNLKVIENCKLGYNYLFVVKTNEEEKEKTHEL